MLHLKHHNSDLRHMVSLAGTSTPKCHARAHARPGTCSLAAALRREQSTIAQTVSVLPSLNGKANQWTEWSCEGAGLVLSLVVRYMQ